MRTRIRAQMLVKWGCREEKKKFLEVLSLFPASSPVSPHCQRVISGAIIKTTELIYLKAFFFVFFVVSLDPAFP